MRRAIDSGASLRGAYLCGANLSYADLTGANLSDVNLSGARLTGANLSDANLSCANLSCARLTSANLSYAKGIAPQTYTPLSLLRDQVGKVRLYKLVNAKGEGIYRGGIKYEVGKTVSVEVVECDETIQNAAGIGVATLDWCAKEWQPGHRIFIVEFTPKDIVAIPHFTDGKIRVRRCRVISEKDLVELGLVAKQEKSAAPRANMEDSQ